MTEFTRSVTTETKERSLKEGNHFLPTDFVHELCGAFEEEMVRKVIATVHSLPKVIKRSGGQFVALHLRCV